MSVYSVKGKGWRYDFTHKGTRYTEAWFKTKKEAKEAEAKKREELKNPPTVATSEVEKTPTDMAFSALANEYLDYAKRKFAEKTYKYKAYVYRQFLAFAGDIPVRNQYPEHRSLSPDPVDEYQLQSPPEGLMCAVYLGLSAADYKRKSLPFPGENAGTEISKADSYA